MSATGMDNVLALLRHELERMQKQDKALYGQLLNLRESIRGLKSELKWEREECEQAYKKLGDFSATEFEDDVFGAETDPDKGNGFKWRHDRQDSGISVKTPESESPETATVRFTAHDVTTIEPPPSFHEDSSVGRPSKPGCLTSSANHNPELISVGKDASNPLVKTTQAQKTRHASRSGLIQHSKQDSGILLEEEAMKETVLLSKLAESPEMLEKLENRKFDLIIQNEWKKARDNSMAGGIHHQRSMSSNDILRFQPLHGGSLSRQCSAFRSQAQLSQGKRFSDGNFRQYNELERVKEGRRSIPFHSRTNSCPVKSFGARSDMHHPESSLARLKEGDMNESFKAGEHKQWKANNEDGENKAAKTDGNQQAMGEYLSKGLQAFENQQLKPVGEGSIGKKPKTDSDLQLMHEKRVNHGGKHTGKEEVYLPKKEGIKQGLNANEIHQSNRSREPHQPLKTETNGKVKTSVEKCSTLNGMYQFNVTNNGSLQQNHRKSLSLSDEEALFLARRNLPRSFSLSSNTSVASLDPSLSRGVSSPRDGFLLSFPPPNSSGSAGPNYTAVFRQTFMTNHRHTRSLPVSSVTGLDDIAERRQMRQENRCSMQNVSACKVMASAQLRPRRRSASVVDVNSFGASENPRGNQTNLKPRQTIPVQFECLEETGLMQDIVDPRIEQTSFASNFVQSGNSKSDNIETSRKTSCGQVERLGKNSLSQDNVSARLQQNSCTLSEATSIDNSGLEQSSKKSGEEIQQKASVKQVESFAIENQSRNNDLIEGNQISNNSKPLKSNVFRVNSLQLGSLRPTELQMNNNVQTDEHQAEQSGKLHVVKPLRTVRVSASEVSDAAIDNLNVSRRCSLDDRTIANHGLRRRFSFTNYKTSHPPPTHQPKNAELFSRGFLLPAGHQRLQTMPEYDVLRRRHSTFTSHAPSKSWDGYASRRSSDIKPMIRSASYVSLV